MFSPITYDQVIGQSMSRSEYEGSPADQADKPVRLLYVDDDPDFLEVVKIILERNGEFRVETCNSGKEALELLKTGDFDIILSDYRMVRMDGLTLLRKVREIDKNFPFILFTGMLDDDIVTEATRSGVTLHLYKEGDTAEQFKRLNEGVRQILLK